ncbi:SymE family type I addiction module toxin [Snodgrassella sp. B3882]|nr:SymE family type I addiction module toxin [Snodgrassella sp. B3882]
MLHRRLRATKPNPSPQLTIKSRWLGQIGFYAGQPVIIKVEQSQFC